MTLSALGIFSAAGAGGAAFSSDYELIETAIVSGSSTNTVTFSGLGSYSSTYKHLQIRFAARSLIASTEDPLFLRFNADSTNTYAIHILEGRGSSVGSYAGVPRTGVFLGAIAGGSITANSFSGGVVDIVDVYGSKNKTVRTLLGSTGGNYVALNSSLWPQTTSPTSISVIGSTANLAAGSRFSLYGIKG